MLIVSECRRCGGKGWLLYDAAFRQQVTDFAETDFSKLNQSLYLTTWRRTVEAVGIVCYQTTHRRSMRCVPNSYTEKVPGERRELVKEKEERNRQRKRGACFARNDGNCVLPYCCFDHVCSKCFGSHRRLVCQSCPWENEKRVGAWGHQRFVRNENWTETQAGGEWSLSPVKGLINCTIAKWYEICFKKTTKNKQKKQQTTTTNTGQQWHRRNNNYNWK